MIPRLLGLLERDAGRMLVAGVALVALGVVTTLRALADAAGQWSDALPLGDRAVLGLYDTHPAHALPFLVGAALVALAVRLRGAEPGPGAGVVAGVAWAYLALGASAAVVAVYTAASGSFGEGAAIVELTRRERTFGLAEQVVGNLAIAVAALAGARALLRPAEPEPALGLEDEAGDEEDEAPLAEPMEEPAGIASPGIVSPVGGNGRPLPPLRAPVPAEALTDGQAPGDGVAEAPDDPDSETITTAERYRRLYDRQLRFSPRAAEARALLARLSDDPEDADTRSALDRLAAPEQQLD